MAIVLIVWVSLSLLVCLACLRAAARPQPSLEAEVNRRSVKGSAVLSTTSELEEAPTPVERNERELETCSLP